MEERTLKWLDINEMRILKQVILISDRQNGETELGSILYTRPLTEHYNFIKQKEEDKEENEENSFKRLFKEYPKQRNYPNDRIDEIIIQAVKKTYPKSIIRNDAILFNVDIEKIDTLKNKNVINSVIYFSPEFSNVANYQEYVGKQFRAPQVDIKIYSYYRPEFLDGQIFYGTYNIDEQNILDDLQTVRFE